LFQELKKNSSVIDIAKFTQGETQIELLEFSSYLRIFETGFRGISSFVFTKKSQNKTNSS